MILLYLIWMQFVSVGWLVARERERGGDWPQPGCCLLLYLFVLIPNRRIIAFWNHIPLFLLIHSPSPSLSLPLSFAHAPISSRLYIHDEHSNENGYTSVVCRSHCTMYISGVKTEPAKSTSQASKQTSCWVPFEKPQKSCAHHNVLTVF